MIELEDSYISLTELQKSKEKDLVEINEFNFRKIKIRCQLGLQQEKKIRKFKEGLITK